MDTMEKYPVIRCPKCGGIHLKSIHEEPITFKEAFFKKKTIFGLIKALTTEPAAYWQCLKCGYTFPIQ